MRRFLMATGLVLSLASAAEAITIRDIIELSRAGLGEDVLLALIEVDGGVFSIDNDTLTTLKKSGVSEKVIVALIKSGRSKPPAPPVEPSAITEPEPEPDPAPAPQVVVIDHHDAPAPVIREVAVPVFVPVRTRRPPRQHFVTPAEPGPMTPFHTLRPNPPPAQKPFILQPEVDAFNRGHWQLPAHNGLRK
jgi:hypothetical protein